MADLVVTKQIALKAVLLGACKIPKVGMKAEDADFSELLWAHEAKLVEPAAGDIPLWARARSGYGSGDGSGYGDGSGDGDGSGYGDGLISRALKFLNS